MTTETAELKLRGEEKFIIAERNFNYQGQKVSIGDRIRIDDDETIKDVLQRRWARLEGGLFTVDHMRDGFHRVTFWGRKYIEGDRFYKCQFLKGNHIFPEGYKCRLRMSDIVEFPPFRYEDLPEPPVNCTRVLTRDPVLMICEPRPRPNIEPEELAERAAAVEAGLRQKDGWMSQLRKD